MKYQNFIHSRRQFLKASALGGAGLAIAPMIFPSSLFGETAPSKKIQIAQIGCGRIAKDMDIPGILEARHRADCCGMRRGHQAHDGCQETDRGFLRQADRQQGRGEGENVSGLSRAAQRAGN
jgi:hypothetical protein